MDTTKKTKWSDPAKVSDVRDALSGLVECVGGDGQEDHVIRCCLGLAIEGLEEWLYDGQFTPSVEPTNPDGEVYVRSKKKLAYLKEKTAKEKYPTIAKLAKDGKFKSGAPVVMASRTWKQMSYEEMQAFSIGDREAFVKAIRQATGCGIKAANQFCKRMRLSHRTEWGTGI